MPAAVLLTLREAAQVLDPPLSEQQLRTIITALGLQAAGYRYTGRRGHPFPVYPADTLMGLHAALVPFLGK